MQRTFSCYDTCIRKLLIVLLLTSLFKLTLRKVSIASPFSSSSSSGDLFCPFSLREEGFSFVGLLVLPHITRKDRIVTFNFRNSLPRDRIRQVATLYFVHPEVEIAIPRIRDDVIHPLMVSTLFT